MKWLAVLSVVALWLAPEGAAAEIALCNPVWGGAPICPDCRITFTWVGGSPVGAKLTGTALLKEGWVADTSVAPVARVGSMGGLTGTYPGTSTYLVPLSAALSSLRHKKQAALWLVFRETATSKRCIQEFSVPYDPTPPPRR